MQVDAGGACRALQVAVVDDELFIRELLLDLLTDMGHVVTCFAAPHAALARLELDRFDIVFCDIHMPGISGMELYERVLCACPETAERIVFLTGDDVAPAIRSFLERTGALYLSKPFELKSLADRISAVLDRAGRTSSTPDSLPRAA